MAGIHASPCQGQNRKQQCHSGQFRRDHLYWQGVGDPRRGAKEGGAALEPEGEGCVKGVETFRGGSSQAVLWLSLWGGGQGMNSLPSPPPSTLL